MNTKPRQKLSVPRPWGHEQFLKELLGKKIEAWGLDDSLVAGTLKSFDRYTVLIEQKVGNNGTTRGILVFKAGITQLNEAA